MKFKWDFLKNGSRAWDFRTINGNTSQIESWASCTSYDNWMEINQCPQVSMDHLFKLGSSITNKDVRWKDLVYKWKIFTVEEVFNRHNDRVYAATRTEADEHGGIHQKSKYPGQIKVWLGASYAGVTGTIIFVPFERLTDRNYMDDVLALALSKGKRLIDDNCIHQQDNTRRHTIRNSEMSCKQHTVLTWISRFILYGML